MKIQLSIAMDDGTSYEGTAILRPVGASSARRVSSTSSKQKEDPKITTRVDMTLPVRAFVKKHAKGMSGPQKFALLVARLTQGADRAAVDAKTIQRTWNSMTEPMGGAYNPAYSTRAKEKDWVDTPKPRLYAIRPNWKAIFD